jgi:diguanylate cyclase (GGDEF)-like protein
LKELVELLESLGISTSQGRASGTASFFPVCLPLRDGNLLRLEMPEPPLVSSLDPELVGLAVLDPIGHVVAAWGLATKLAYLRPGKCALDSPLRGFLDRSDHGSGSSIFVDGFRFFFAGMGPGMGAMKLVLLVNAWEESLIKRESAQSRRAADALKRLGNTLSMNQNRTPLCLAVTHELASSLEMAAVLLWALDTREDCLELVASVGANRQGLSALRKLNAYSGSTCAAELVASTRQVFFQVEVSDHVLSADLEAKLCYLRPGGVSVHPLETSGKLLGVLELIGREGDPHFAESRELFQTIAEHLSLAIHTAELFENLERLASHDPLTGLANHRYMQEFLHQRLHEAIRTQQTLGLLMVDVDHFRAFNEEEGHDAGDEVLCLVAETLRGCVRPYDIAARYGGEEFALIMPGSDLEAAAAVAERVRRRVEMRPFTTKSGRHAHVTVSIGCSAYPETAADPSTLLKAADLALYDAKRAGRNRVARFEGTYVAPPRRNAIDLEALHNWTSEEDWEAGLQRCARLEIETDGIAASLALSDSQREMLKGLLILGPIYLNWTSEEESERLNQFESSEEARVLTPSLQSLAERFDGKGGHGVHGKKLPLLGRVARVLLSIDAAEALYEDTGRFDPEILALATGLHRAA